ncbi:hypothetical protein [Kineothrix sedimenti]|uniref:Phage protein n=1 Tax=Kineothrix sedimenti TaxID=3123317 RepID=A0ABZ3F2Z5_9FIRM
MSTLRKLERSVVKGSLTKEKVSIKRNFANAWSDFREKKFVVKDDDGNVLSDNTPRNTMKKKQRHFDNVEQYNRLFAYAEALKKEKAEK